MIYGRKTMMLMIMMLMIMMMMIMMMITVMTMMMMLMTMMMMMMMICYIISIKSAYSSLIWQPCNRRPNQKYSVLIECLMK